MPYITLVAHPIWRVSTSTLNAFLSNSELREQKITELFLAAFSFVNERSNWRAITALADYIISEDKSIIECNEIIAVLGATNCSC